MKTGRRNVLVVLGGLGVALALVVSAVPAQESRSWDCAILPSEAAVTTDSVSGAEVVFVTTHPAVDVNLYFHQRSWLTDGSLLLFLSNRSGRQELFGYIEATGELVRLTSPGDPVPRYPTASIAGNGVYLMKGNAVYRWEVELRLKPRTEVRVTERKIADLGRTTTELTESCDRRYLATHGAVEGGAGSDILLIDVQSGTVSTAVTLPYSISHLQFSRTRPDLIMYAHRYGTDYAPPDTAAERHCRMWLANIKTHVSWPLHWQEPGELNTHECWWVGDQITFCGGYARGWSPVRVLDLHTGVMRVIGEGAYWEGATPAELAEVNWWHASGDYQGRWVAADNWHGIIALFDATTTQRRILAVGHRTYGGGVHPHVGWNHLGGEVVFASNRRGNPDVCVARIPKDWERKR